jgi:hypothetical protein
MTTPEAIKSCLKKIWIIKLTTSSLNLDLHRDPKPGLGDLKLS